MSNPDFYKPFTKCPDCGGWGYTVHRGKKTACLLCEYVGIEREKFYDIGKGERDE